jgi:hypothetical protein
MFDPVTRRFLATAPALPGLAPEALADEFTRTFVEISAARLTLTSMEPEQLDQLAELSERMGRIANVFEAQVILGLAGDRTRAAAFVAGSARQVVFQISQLLATGSSTRVDELAISSDLAAALLFLISERTADSYETSRLIDAYGMRGIHGQIAIAISHLARGQLNRITEVQLERFFPRKIDLLGESASDLLYYRVLQGLHELARRCLGEEEISTSEDPSGIFAEVRDLAVENAGDDLEGEVVSSAQVPSVFPGAHHLAGLLERVASTLMTAAVVRIPPPDGANPESWVAWLKAEALRYPFIWENHQRAIETGFLAVGQSLVMTSPTGSGKTTLATLKIAATLCGGKTVVYLAPTHALVNQVEHDLNERLQTLARARSVEDSLLEEIGQQLPDIAVLTPERCFTLLTFAPHLFKNVGLLVFDECHLLGIERATADPSRVFDRRSIDAMFCLLAFASSNKNSDYLLLSAMVCNGKEISDWLQTITGRRCDAFDDKWKPTRQLKACICYERDAINEVKEELRRDVRKRGPLPPSVPTAVKSMAAAAPLGIFSGGMGWHPDDNPDSFAIRSLTDSKIGLGVARRASYWGLTANRNEVAAELAISCCKAGLKVVVFCESIPTTISVARRINEALGSVETTYDETQQSYRKKLEEELGGLESVYDAGNLPAAVHHGELLLEERLLVEQLFRSRVSNVNALAATSTIAQGLNLPCEVVILAGTDRIDDTDPTETRRTDLMPHEILNALGRAGRAGMAATGLAIVVPANIITCEPDQSDVQDVELLATIFSESDQCAPLSDPIAGLYDDIVAHGATSGEADYLLKKLALSLGGAREGIESFDDLTRRSFGYFLRAKANIAAANEWVTSRRVQLASLIEAATEDKDRNWIQEIAAKSGSSPKLITKLSDAFAHVPADSPDALVWIKWLLMQLPVEESDFDNFMRPEDVERVFGRGYTSAESVTERRARARDAVLTVLPGWFSAAPLTVLERQIVAFIAAHEGRVKRPTTEDTKAKRARRFALRLVSHLSYLSGVLAQVAAKVAAAKGNPPLAITQSLPQLVRRGFNSPYHLYLDRLTPGQSRQSIEAQFNRLFSQIKRGPADEWDTIRAKIDGSLFASAFDELPLLDVEGKPWPIPPLGLPKPSEEEG